MSLFYNWRNRYRIYADDTVWNLIGYGIYEYASAVPMLQFSGRDAKSIDVEDLLRPESIFHGFFISAVLAESYDGHIGEFAEQLIDFSRDPKNKPIDSDQMEAKISKLLEEYKLLNDTGKNIFAVIGDPDGIRQYILRKYGNRKNLTDWCDLLNWYKKVRDRNVAKFGGDRDFVAKLETFFVRAGKQACVLNANDVLRFTIDYQSAKVEEVSDRLSFEEISRYYVDLQKKITQKVICQDTAVRKFVSGLFDGKLRKKEDANEPENCYLFVGPPGVGKTYLAETFAGLSGRPYKRFNMSEYANESSFHGLIGFEETWKNAKPGDLTSYVSRNENAVLIFDEIEKAHVNTIYLFLSILEGGSLTDLYTQEDVDFKQTMVIFTTNAGRQFYESKKGMSISSLPENTLIDALKSDVRPDGSPVMPTEILSRMSKGYIIGFDHMDPAKLVPIIKTGLQKGGAIVKEKMGIECEYDESMLPYLFLYHVGGNIDARVASSRSVKFIKESIFNIAERIGEDAKQFKKAAKDKDNVKVYFDVIKDDIATDLTEMNRIPEILVVCNSVDVQKFRSKKYKWRHVYAERESDDYTDYITAQIRDHKIDAILVDPFMREKKTGKDSKLEGLSHKDTMGNRVIDWLMTRHDCPPVYCVELKDEPIGFVDRQDLYQRGIKGIIELSQAKNQAEREDMIDSLCYEIFLAEKLDKLTRRGRSLEFDIGHSIESDKDSVILRLYLNNFRLIRSMDSAAQDIFISDDSRASESFDEVIGQESAKEELRRFIRFINDPDVYRRSGQQISKGILMYGPPGTGKTMLARALACEADCPFISATGTQFVVGEKNLTEVFRLARQYAPSVVFIDEIESFALDSRTGKQHTEILKQLLTEMDGFDNSTKPVFVIAATNAAKSPNLGERNIFLDEALLRRFTKRVYMKWPDRKERIAFLKNRKDKFKGNQYSLDCLTDKDIEYFADVTAGRSLSEMSNVLNLAIGRAAELETPLTKEILITCFEEYRYGDKREYSPDHMRVTALHEAGHAFMGFYCDDFKKGRFTPEFATIISRGGYLGMVNLKRDEMMVGYTKDELIKHIRIALAGRASEMVFAGKKEEGLTTGASNDLESATSIAASILSGFGMEEGFLATLPAEIMMNSVLARDYHAKLNGILRQELDETIRIIKENKEKVRALADALLDRSRLDTQEMCEILMLTDAD